MFFGRKPKQRLNYIRPFHNKASERQEANPKIDEREVNTETKGKDIDLLRCLQCQELKPMGGTLRCYRNKCKYGG